MNKKRVAPVVLYCTASLYLAGCAGWDGSITPATLEGPTYKQANEMQYFFESSGMSCPTPQEVARMEKEWYKLSLE